MSLFIRKHLQFQKKNLSKFSSNLFHLLEDWIEFVHPPKPPRPLIFNPQFLAVISPMVILGIVESLKKFSLLMKTVNSFSHILFI